MLLHPWDFPGKSTGVGCHFLLQRIFLTQGSNPVLPHCRQMFYHLSHQGSLACSHLTIGNCAAVKTEICLTRTSVLFLTCQVSSKANSEDQTSPGNGWHPSLLYVLGSTQAFALFQQWRYYQPYDLDSLFNLSETFFPHL